MYLVTYSIIVFRWAVVTMTTVGCATLFHILKHEYTYCRTIHYIYLYTITCLLYEYEYTPYFLMALVSSLIG